MYPAEKKEKTIVLVGTPNVGKSLIFNHLTGKYATVSNYPGTTVDISYGKYRLGKDMYIIFDTPGINSIIPHSEDEEVTMEIILEKNPEVILQIADAKNLKRTLHLTFELSMFNIPMVLCLNMMDEATERGISIDVNLLEKMLGIPVVQTIATIPQGIDKLKSRIREAKIMSQKIEYPKEIKTRIEAIEKRFFKEKKPLEALNFAILFGSDSILKHIKDTSNETMLKELISFIEAEKKYMRNLEYSFYNIKEKKIIEITDQVEKHKGAIPTTAAGKINSLLIHPLYGWLPLLLTLYIMYLSVGKFTVGVAVDFIEKNLFKNILIPFCTSIIEKILPVKLLMELLVGEFGLLSMALTYSFAIILPIVCVFFLFFGLLEDSGYIPRMCILLDRFFRFIGLNGKAVLPMLLGLGCGTMGVLSTRVLDTKRDRSISIILLSLAIPCSAQLGVILGILGGISIVVLFSWLCVIIFSLLCVGYLANRILPGERTPLLVELPPLRCPNIKNILIKVKIRLIWYLKEAVPLFILGSFLLFIFDKLLILSLFERILSPLTNYVAGLPSEVVPVFIMGFLRRDYGVAGLYRLVKGDLLTIPQIFISTTMICLFVPCVAQFFMVIRERGLKEALLIFLFCIFFAFSIGGLLNLITKLIKM